MSAFKPAAAYACGMITLVCSRVTEHQGDHGGAYPRELVLHRVSRAALRNECVQRFGVVEDGAFMGIPLSLCLCTKPEAQDYMVTAEDKIEPL